MMLTSCENDDQRSCILAVGNGLLSVAVVVFAASSTS